MSNIKQISRKSYGFLPGHVVSQKTLTRDSSNVRRPYTLEVTMNNGETFSTQYRTAKWAISAYRDCFRSRHGRTLNNH